MFFIAAVTIIALGHLTYFIGKMTVSSVDSFNEKYVQLRLSRYTLMVSEDGDIIEGVMKAIKTTEEEVDIAYEKTKRMSIFLVIATVIFVVAIIFEIILLVLSVKTVEDNEGVQLMNKEKFSDGLKLWAQLAQIICTLQTLRFALIVLKSVEMVAS